MSSISNRFYVTALEDGTTLHGNLVSTKPLTQAWNGSSAVPDWTVAANQPEIYLTLLSGGSLVAPDTTYTWYYNDTAIEFNASTGISTNPSGLFQKTTKNVTYGSTTIAMPCLKIVGNLATSDNVDIDRIRFEGGYVINGTGVSFATETQVRISRITAGSFLGVINFVDGISDITEAGQTITMYGTLFTPTGETAVGYATKWILNGDTANKTNGSNLTVDGTTYNQAYQVSEGSIVDHAIISCEFYSDSTYSNLLYTAYAAVDDVQDPEFMYIQYDGANGNAASLRKGESATFTIWVGRREDPAVITAWNTFQVKLLDGSGNVITAGISGISGADANGWRPLTIDSFTNKANITLAYNVVSTYGKNLTGIVMASQTTQS